jgi:hypothetical protein
MAATGSYNQCFGNPHTQVDLVWACGGGGGGGSKGKWRILQDKRFILVVNIINLKMETETTSETSRILNNEHALNSGQYGTQLRSMPSCEVCLLNRKPLSEALRE